MPLYLRAPPARRRVQPSAAADPRDDAGVHRRLSAGQFRFGAALKSEILRRNHIGLEPAGLKLTDRGRRAHRDLIQLILSVNHHAAFDAERDQYLGKRRDKILVIDAKKLKAGAAGIGQRAKDVEHGAKAQLFADRADIFHGGMVFLREEETHTHFVQQFPAPLGATV